MVPGRNDLFSEEGMKSWRRGEVRSSSLSEYTGRGLKTEEKDLRDGEGPPLGSRSHQPDRRETSRNRPRKVSS